MRSLDENQGNVNLHGDRQNQRLPRNLIFPAVVARVSPSRDPENQVGLGVGLPVSDRGAG